MQGLSSSALGAPVEGQAAAGNERANEEFDELRRAALERVDASKRHKTGILPGMVFTCQVRAVLLRAAASLHGFLDNIGSASPKTSSACRHHGLEGRPHC